MQDDRPTRPQRSTGAGAASITARLESLRSLLTNFERHTTEQHGVALQAIDSERRDRETQLQEQERRTSHLNDEGLFESQTTASPTSPSSIVRTRRQMFSARERLARQRNRMDRLARQDLFDRDVVESTGSNLVPVNTSSARQRSASAELELEPRSSREGGRSKRRKLDDGSSNHHLPPAYGLEGTLLPGNLKMRVLDYPQPEDPLPPADDLARSRIWEADNNDIFRTKKHKCTILMKHQGGWPFTLSNLVIKTPKHDYTHDTSPLQGMVFVSMDQDQLLERTSYYDTLFPVSYVLHRARRYDSYRPSHDYMYSTRSPMRSLLRARQLLDLSDSQWCDPSQSVDEPINLPRSQGISTTVERLLPDPNLSAESHPRSPRPWHSEDYDRSDAFMPRRTLYTDTYRPSYTSTSTLTPHQAARARQWQAAAAAAEAETDILDPEPEPDPAISESPSPSDSSTDDHEQDQDQEDETPHYRDNPSFAEVEARQSAFHEQTRARREPGRGERSDNQNHNITYAPSSSYPSLPLYTANTTVAAVVGPGAAATASDDPDDYWTRGPPTAHAYGRPPAGTSTKRLPGCNEMLRGRRASDTTSDGNANGDPNGPLAPHATFQATRDAGGAVVVRFEPEV